MSGKNRKFGRNKKRSPSMARYVAEDRAAKNKRLRIEKEKRRQEFFKKVGDLRGSTFKGKARWERRREKREAYAERMKEAA